MNRNKNKNKENKKKIIEYSVENAEGTYFLMKNKLTITDAQDDIHYNILERISEDKVNNHSNGYLVLNNTYNFLRLEEKVFSREEDFLVFKHKCINTFLITDIFPAYYQKHIMNVYIDKLTKVKNIEELSFILLKLLIHDNDLQSEIVLYHKFDLFLKDFNKNGKLEMLRHLFIPLILNFNSRFHSKKVENRILEGKKFYKFIQISNIHEIFKEGDIVYSNQFITFGEEAQLIDNYEQVIIKNRTYNTILQFTMSRNCEKDFRSIINVTDISNTENILYIMCPVTKFKVSKVNSSVQTIRKIKYQSVELEEIDENHLYDTIMHSLYLEKGFCENTIKKRQFEKLTSFYDNCLRTIADEIEVNCFDNALISDTISFIYYCHKEYAVSLEFSVKALEMKVSKLEEQGLQKDDNLSVADTYLRIGDIYYNLERGLDALEYYNKSLKIYSKLLGLSHLKVAEVYIKVGKTLSYLVDNDEAIKYLNNGLIIQKKILGEVNLETCETLILMGKVIEETNDYEDSRNFYQFALDSRLQLIGENSLLIVLNYIDLGCVYYKMESFEISINYFNKALSLQLNSKGENNEIIAKIYNHIGNVFIRKFVFNPEKAFEYFKKALTVWDTIYNGDAVDFEVADCYVSIGKAYHRAENYQLAILNYEKAMKIKKYLYENNEFHKEIYKLIIVIAECHMILFTKEKFKFILEMYEKALKIEITLSKEQDSYQTAIVLEKMGELYYKMCLYDLGLDYLLHSLKMKTKLLVTPVSKYKIHYDKKMGIITDRFHNGVMLIGKTMKYLTAKVSKITMEELKTEVMDKIVRFTLKDENFLIFKGDYSFYILNNTKKAIRNYYKAVRKIEDLYLHKNKTEICYERIANVYFETFNYSEAIVYYNKALEFMKKTLRNKDDRYYTKLYKCNKLLEYYKKILKTEESLNGKYHISLSSTLKNIGQFYFDLSEYDLSKEYFDLSNKVKYNYKTSIN